jgi:hypothetical protein
MKRPPVAGIVVWKNELESQLVGHPKRLVQERPNHTGFVGEVERKPVNVGLLGKLHVICLSASE